MFRFCLYLFLHISCSLPISLSFSEDFILFCVSEFSFIYIRQLLATEITRELFSPLFSSISSHLAVVLIFVSMCCVICHCIRASSSSPNYIPYHQNPSEVSQMFHSLFACFTAHFTVCYLSSLHTTSSPVLSRLGENFLGLLRVCLVVVLCWFCP